MFKWPPNISSGHKPICSCENTAIVENGELFEMVKEVYAHVVFLAEAFYQGWYQSKLGVNTEQVNVSDLVG